MIGTGKAITLIELSSFLLSIQSSQKRSFEVRPTFLDTFSNQFPRYSVHSPYAHIGVRWAKKKVVLLQCFSLSFLLPSTFLKHGTFAQFLALFEKQFSTFFSVILFVNLPGFIWRYKCTFFEMTFQRFFDTFGRRTRCLKITKKSHSILRAKWATFTFSLLKVPKLVNFVDCAVKQC